MFCVQETEGEKYSVAWIMEHMHVVKNTMDRIYLGESYCSATY